ncbi:MAG TPA: T9SS type A sorting domain-containing protein, partial [Candidatus Krumholzibacteria bacterium]|nr:T9SS type A sorting domain-containing protein [Candidatus Krumholzibacteria bacterium]
DFGSGLLTSSDYIDMFLASFGTLPTGVGDAPMRGALAISAYPNPFNPQTTIRYTVPSTGRVVVAVYDARGARVATLVDAARAAGSYTQAWDGRDDAGRAVSSGVYFARISHASGSKSEKIVLLK